MLKLKKYLNLLMMQENNCSLLKKLAEDFYIIVDNSEITSTGYYYDYTHNKIMEGVYLDSSDGNCKNITHATQLLNTSFNDWFDVTLIPLSEVEEAIYGYSVEKMANTQWGNVHRTGVLGYIEGFKAHRKLIKDKLLSTHLYFNNNHLEWVYNRMIEIHGENPNYDYMIKFKEIIQSLLPKTEWDVEFDENGKLKLI
jgi:hypothetical protein